MQHPVDIIFLIGLSKGLIEVPPLLCMAFPCTDTDCVAICVPASVKVERSLLSLADGLLRSVGKLQGNRLNRVVMIKVSTMPFVLNTTAPCAECCAKIAHIQTDNCTKSLSQQCEKQCFLCAVWCFLCESEQKQTNKHLQTQWNNGNSEQILK